MYRFPFVLAVIVAAVLFAGAHTAAAEGARREGGVIRLEEITIEGRVQKPNAWYVLARSSLGFERAQMEQSFVNEVVESVNQEPF
jgi:hypothetical protein